MWSQTRSRGPAASRLAGLRQVSSWPLDHRACRLDAPSCALAPLGPKNPSGQGQPGGTSRAVPGPTRHWLPFLASPASRLQSCVCGSRPPLSRPPAALALASEQTPKGLGRAGSLGTPGFEVCPVSGCCSAHRREISFKATCSEGGGPLHPALQEPQGEACPPSTPVSFLRRAGSVAGVCLCRGGAAVPRGHCRLPPSRLAGRLATQSPSPWDSEGRSRQETVRKADLYPAGPSGGSSRLWDSWFWFITRDTGAMGSGWTCS